MRPGQFFFILTVIKRHHFLLSKMPKR
jgi:hypothetical protein